MNEEEILNIIKRGESSKVQFKERMPHADSLAHELIAFSNSNLLREDGSLFAVE